MKISKKLILTSFLLLAGVIIISILGINNNNDSKDNTNTTNNNSNNLKVSDTYYVAYVDINPLIKLNFKISCDKDNNCTNPIVTDYELINEDAKTFYKDLIIKDKPLKETIELLANTVKDKDIVFKEVHIYTNYDKEDVFKVDSADFNITLDVKNNKDLEQFISDLKNVKVKEIITPIVFPKDFAETMTQLFRDGIRTYEDCNRFELIDNLETFTLKYGEQDVKGIKVTISGPAELINTIPYQDGENYRYVEAMIEASNTSIGEYIVPLTIISRNPSIKIVNAPSTQVKYGVVDYNSAHICFREE